MGDFDVVALLKIADSPVLSQFLHDCIDDLVKIKAASYDNYNNDIEWTNNDFNRAKATVQYFYRKCIEKGNIDNVNLEDFSENIQKELHNCYEIRRNDIYEYIIKEKLLKHQHNLVETFDWRLKWILGNSKLASIRQPILQMDLYCLKNNADDQVDRNLINFEMDIDTVGNLIQQLEKVKREIANNKD